MPLKNFLHSLTPLRPSLRLPLTLLNTTILAHIFTQYFFSTIPLQGPSMLPTIEVIGDWTIVNRSYRRGRGVKVGDIVQFDSVVEPGGGVVKRVLGMPGDYVLRDTPGVEGGGGSMLQVPQGHCWVVGDNLKHSRDSRHFGPVPLALIKGKLIAKVLPWSERRWIEDDVKLVSQGGD